MAKEVFTFDLCGRNLTIETGEIAKQAGGAVVVRYQDTVVLSTATANHTPKDSDFFPLTVSFEEKLSSVGKIPGGFLRREGRPSAMCIRDSGISGNRPFTDEGGSTMSQSALLRRLLRYVKPYGLLLGMALVFALLQVAMTLSAPVIIGQAVDAIVAAGQVDFIRVTPTLAALSARCV